MDNIIINIDSDSKYKITLVCQWCGKDLNVSIFGGDTPHIGAVAMAISNLENYTRKYSPTINVLTVMDHKDDEIAKVVAKDLATHFNCQVVVAAGVHIDNATQGDLLKIMENVKEILQRLKCSYPKKSFN